MDLLSRRSRWKFAGPDRPRLAGLLRACALSIGIAAGLAGARPAQADAQADEYRVKAAFLYKFGSYIEWPSGSFARADSPVTIGVMGADALADELALQPPGDANVHGSVGRNTGIRQSRDVSNSHVELSAVGKVE